LLHVSSGTLAFAKPVWSVDGNVQIGFGRIPHQPPHVVK
jgi:hypothetical protein